MLLFTPFFVYIIFMANKITNFLFGRLPKIFDKKGEVVHNLGIRSWSHWKHRYKEEEYDWRNHSGRSRNIKSSKN